MLIELRMETFRSNKWPFLWLWVGKGPQSKPKGALWSLGRSRFQATQRSGLCGWMESAWGEGPGGNSVSTTGRAVSWGAKGRIDSKCLGFFILGPAD